MVAEREKDFTLISQMKEEHSYIFTSDSKHDQMLRRESVTRSINKILRQVFSQLPNNPRITSHSFRAGYITQL